MLEAIWKSTLRVLKHWTTMLGGVSTIMGTLQHFGVIANTIPSWVWLGIAVALIFGTAVRIDMELVEAQRRGSPESNMPLEEVVRRITGFSSPHENHGEAGQLIADAFISIRELALQGHLAVFGRHIALTSDVGWHPRELIPPAYWKTHQIGYMEYMKDRRGETPRCRAGGDQAPYQDLYFDRAQVDRRWSARRRVIDWRNPIRRKERAVART